jgi:hypothetical protein
MAHEQQQARDKDRITRLEARLQGVDEDLRRAQQQYADVRTPGPPCTCLAGLMAVVAQTAQELEECRMQLRDSERVRLPPRRGGGLLIRWGGRHARSKRPTWKSRPPDSSRCRPRFGAPDSAVAPVLMYICVQFDTMFKREMASLRAKFEADLAEVCLIPLCRSFSVSPHTPSQRETQIKAVNKELLTARKDTEAERQGRLDDQAAAAAAAKASAQRFADLEKSSQKVRTSGTEKEEMWLVLKWRRCRSFRVCARSWARRSRNCGPSATPWRSSRHDGLFDLTVRKTQRY